jgi:hypothetical protein
MRRTSGDAGPRLCDTVRKEAAGAPPIPLPLEARATGTKLWLARLGRFPRSSTAAAAPMNVVAVSHLVGRRPIRRSATSRPAWSAGSCCRVFVVQSFASPSELPAVASVSPAGVVMGPPGFEPGTKGL